MSILERFFGGKTTAITADIVRADITRCENEITALQAKADDAILGIATMSDSDHIAAEADIAGTKRAIARLDARVAHLTSELPKVIAAGDAAVKIATDEALRQRAEAARRANLKEAAKLLTEYEKLAGSMADIFARLGAIVDETNAVNAELHKNPVAESVRMYDELHRKSPDQPASERVAARPCWVTHYPGSPRDTERAKFLQYPPSEEVCEASLRPDGTPFPAQPVLHEYYGRTITIQPRLETRDIVVKRTPFRRGIYEAPLSEISLPPAFARGKRHWPRE